jgi:hypothetical protein
MTGLSRGMPPDDPLHFDETGPRPPGHIPACIYGCCWKLPGQTWAEAKKKWRPPNGDQGVSTSPRTLSGTKGQSKRRKAQWLSKK